MLDELKSLALARVSGVRVSSVDRRSARAPPNARALPWSALCYFAAGTHTALAEASSTPATSVLIDTF